MVGEVQPKHFVAVHGVGHGAWVYNKLKRRIEAADHKFTPISLAAAGNVTVEQRSRRFTRCTTIQSRCARHLRLFLRAFLNALMPGSKNRPSYVIDEYLKRTPPEAWMDTQFPTFGDPPIGGLLCGPKFRVPLQLVSN